jgi:hypothetical protein
LTTAAPIEMTAARLFPALAAGRGSIFDDQTRRVFLLMY